MAVVAAAVTMTTPSSLSAQGTPARPEVTIAGPIPLPVTGSATVSGTVALAPGSQVTVVNEVTVVSSADRNPYQQIKQTAFGSALCGNAIPSQCIVTFSPVPAGKRLVAQYISASIAVDAGTAIRRVELGGAQFGLFVPAVFQSNAGGADVFNVSSEILAYFEPGQTPSVVIVTEGNNQPWVGNVALSGHFVSAP